MIDKNILSQEFADQFDVLYNNVTSNQAPGLNAYEKSIFLTKAQDDIIKSYFNPKENKTFEGFDGSEKRQIDFSMLIRTKKLSIGYNLKDGKIDYTSPEDKYIPYLDNHNNSIRINIEDVITTTHKIKKEIPLYKKNIDKDGNITYEEYGSTLQELDSVTLKEPIMFIINEFVDVSRHHIIEDSKTDKLKGDVRCSVIPLTYDEYAKMMSKPYKRPAQYQTWRLIVDADECFELIPATSTDKIIDYFIRYVKRPNPIILEDIKDDNVTINGVSEQTTCELDPILYPEIIQRAVELAKAHYQGDLATIIQVGANSGTDKGYIAQQQNRQQ